MRTTLGLCITGISFLIWDPRVAGFAADAHGSVLLALGGAAGIALLTLWSEEWTARRVAAAGALGLPSGRLEFSFRSMPAREHTQ